MKPHAATRTAQRTLAAGAVTWILSAQVACATEAISQLSEPDPFDRAAVSESAAEGRPDARPRHSGFTANLPQPNRQGVRC